MDNNIFFKKVLLGGFDREEVMKYISRTNDEFFRYKKDTVLKVEEMKKKTEELEKAYNALLEENVSLKEEVRKISEAETQEKDDKTDIRSLIESLTESMNVLIGVLSTEDGEKEDDDCDDESESSANEVQNTDEGSLIDDIIDKYLNYDN